MPAALGAAPLSARNVVRPCRLAAWKGKLEAEPVADVLIQIKQRWCFGPHCAE
jgi:hypothetical protein